MNSNQHFSISSSLSYLHSALAFRVGVSSPRLPATTHRKHASSSGSFAHHKNRPSILSYFSSTKLVVYTIYLTMENHPETKIDCSKVYVKQSSFSNAETGMFDGAFAAVAFKEGEICPLLWALVNVRCMILTHHTSSSLHR